MTAEEQSRIDALLSEAVKDDVSLAILADMLADTGSAAIRHVLRRWRVDLTADPLITMRGWAWADRHTRMAANVIRAVERLTKLRLPDLTVGHLAALSKEELQSIPNLVGDGSLKLAREFLASRNLALRGEDWDWRV